MTKHTHYVLTCTKNHTWHEPILATKPAMGEHRLCPICGGSSWIAPDALKITKIANTDIQISVSPEVEKELTNLGINVESEIQIAAAFLESKVNTPSPDAISQTKKIPIPVDLIPTRELLNEEQVHVVRETDDVLEIFSPFDSLEPIEPKANN